MAKIVEARVVANERRAYVSVNGGEATRCPLRKEGSGLWTICLAGYVEGVPQKYWTIGELKDATYRRDVDSFKYREVGSTGIPGGSICERLKKDLDMVALQVEKGDVSQELYDNFKQALDPILNVYVLKEAAEKQQREIDAIDKRIAELLARKAQLEG